MEAVAESPRLLSRRVLAAWGRWQEAASEADRSRIAGYAGLAEGEVAALARFAENMRGAQDAGGWFEWGGSKNHPVYSVKRAVLDGILAGLALRESEVPLLTRILCPSKLGGQIAMEQALAKRAVPLPPPKPEPEGAEPLPASTFERLTAVVAVEGLSVDRPLPMAEMARLGEQIGRSAATVEVYLRRMRRQASTEKEESEMDNTSESNGSGTVAVEEPPVAVVELAAASPAAEESGTEAETPSAEAPAEAEPEPAPKSKRKRPVNSTPAAGTLRERVFAHLEASGLDFTQPVSFGDTCRLAQELQTGEPTMRTYISEYRAVRGIVATRPRADEQNGRRAPLSERLAKRTTALEAEVAALKEALAETKAQRESDYNAAAHAWSTTTRVVTDEQDTQGAALNALRAEVADLKARGEAVRRSDEVARLREDLERLRVVLRNHLEAPATLPAGDRSAAEIADILIGWGAAHVHPEALRGPIYAFARRALPALPLAEGTEEEAQE